MPPALSDLFAEYLRGQTEAQSEGLGFADLGGEVEPYESVPVQPVDPKQAWADALAAADLFGAKAAWATPLDWPMLVAGQEPAVALAFCLGNYPQMVRNLHPLLAGGDLAALRAVPARAPAAAALIEWAQGLDRLSRCPPGGRRAAAGSAVRPRRGVAAPPGSGRMARPSMPMKRRRWPGIGVGPRKPRRFGLKQPDSVPVLFNRGMSALFLGDAATARDALARAAADLPETGAWHHLARLYIAMASARR